MEKSKLNSQEHILLIVEMLVENKILGMTNKILATELGTSEANVCRDLKILESRQWVEKSARWTLAALRDR
jgi:DeoR/GlpR family transcriptional regulator of sugar metabolism